MPVHYKGGGETIKDIVSGEVKVMFSTIPPVLGLVKDGTLNQGDVILAGDCWYEAGLAAVEELRALVPAGMTMAQFALRWILMQDAVTVAIAGAKSMRQAQENAAASNLPPLVPETMRQVAAIYDRRIAPSVHQRW